MALSPSALQQAALLGFVLACGSPPGTASDAGEAPHAAVAGATLPLTNAERDEGDPAIVAVMAALSGEPWLLCTGTLIGPRAVLTAAHCLNDTEVTPLRVVFGAETRAPSSSLGVVDRRIHPDYRPEPLADHDLAVLVLEQRVSVAPVALSRAVLDDSARGKPVRLVGFGLSDLAGSLGQKLMGTARIDAVEDSRFRVGPDPSLTCFHDSGAPALSATDAAEVLLGVTTSGDPECKTFSRFMRVDRYVDDFIVPSVALADALPVPRLEPPPQRGGCALAGGVDGAPALAGLVALVLLRGLAMKRRRRNDSGVRRRPALEISPNLRRGSRTSTSNHATRELEDDSNRGTRGRG